MQYPTMFRKCKSGKVCAVNRPDCPVDGAMLKKNLKNHGVRAILYEADAEYLSVSVVLSVDNCEI